MQTCKMRESLVRPGSEWTRKRFSGRPDALLIREVEREGYNSLRRDLSPARRLQQASWTFPRASSVLSSRSGGCNPARVESLSQGQCRPGVNCRPARSATESIDRVRRLHSPLHRDLTPRATLQDASCIFLVASTALSSRSGGCKPASTRSHGL